MITLLAQIEAVLNSRPLIGLSGDEIDKIDVLTPGHFLIGRPIHDCPEHIGDSNISSLNRWKLIQKLRKDFWNRWRDEYITTLQQRNKWKFSQQNLQKGTIVLVKDENTNPANWPLAKISELHSGKDGKVRVVSLKLQNNTLKRPISKLCPVVSEKTDEETSPPVRSCFTREEQPKKKNICFFMLFLMMLVNPINSLPIRENGAVIKELSNNTAIYLDNIGQLNTINSKWNLIVYYDLELYYEELLKIGQIIKKIDEECGKLNEFRDSCNMVMAAMDRRYKLLVQNNELLFVKTRNKRAPFEFVGSIYNILFGMMDANDREQMEQNMKIIFGNQKDLNMLIKEQTTVVDSTINILKKTTEDVNRNFQKMSEHLKRFCAEVNKEVAAQQRTLLFTVMTTQLNLMIDECSRVQSSIINLLIDVNHGHINTDLLTPSQLQHELHEIEKVLPNNLALPGKATGTELKEVYHDLKAKGAIIESKLIVQLEIPLVTTHISEVYQMIRLPIEIGASAVMPIVQNEFIVYNFATNMYYLMSLAQLNKCGRNLQGYYNCAGNMPWKPAIERSCEVSALKQSRHAECLFEAVPRKSIWKELSQGNQWIFTIFDNFMLSVNCGLGNRSWITLPAKGILQLADGCAATYEGISLVASNNLASEKKSSIQTSSWEVQGDKVQSKLVKPFDISIINNTVSIEQLQKDVNIMKSKNVKLRELQLHVISGHTSLIVICITMFILVCLIIKKKCCKTKNVVKIDITPPAPLVARQNVQMS